MPRVCKKLGTATVSRADAFNKTDSERKEKEADFNKRKNPKMVTLKVGSIIGRRIKVMDVTKRRNGVVVRASAS